MYFFKRSGLRAPQQGVPVSRVYVNGEALDRNEKSQQSAKAVSTAALPNDHAAGTQVADGSEIYTPTASGPDFPSAQTQDDSWIRSDVVRADQPPTQTGPAIPSLTLPGRGDESDPGSGALSESDSRSDSASERSSTIVATPPTRRVESSEPDGLFGDDVQPGPKVLVWGNRSESRHQSGGFVTQQFRSTSRKDVQFVNGQRAHPRVGDLEVFGKETN